MASLLEANWRACESGRAPPDWKAKKKMAGKGGMSWMQKQDTTAGPV
jgi:hypothetical protein